MFAWLIIGMGAIGAFFDTRALRLAGKHDSALAERHRLRVIALRFYRGAFAVYVGTTLGSWRFG